ncbi:vacuolar protein sorting-associated protein 35 [Polychytrium aggregatum]|uniref:vacuolar protein sorting-associated protein 35 n=1 Tax=Polychytrium aggregatum TaxID=110093 RepID=UPI0022FE8E98|nr:vacuolar protein sorting-associated protein 35 [Polychytrium aggregatum]KAI9208650.1 vacuolar protein sorting-associated protein 35 [Polychytrium aggregatum]
MSSYVHTGPSNPATDDLAPVSNPISPAPIEAQSKILEEALSVIKVQAFHMKRCLENNKLMDALKHCSTMLTELRTSALTPKSYYELYMSIFDELRHLTIYLYDAHMSRRHHLSDLYELVQYAGSVVPRLYLMVTVGSVYMRVSKEAQSSKDGNSQAASDPIADVPPIKELMKDMLEMSRGVQHPTRGLFLRYYLSTMTRDYLPDGTIDGPHGTIHDSIHFILQNFMEMNKLWVRLQHQGPMKERELRERERKELRLLVGSNLVRLSQLDGLDFGIYSSLVLPVILDEIVSCKDLIAQEYLMEVIIQVFPDDFHLRSLDSFLSATAQLQRSVNVKQIVISLIDRFSSYAARTREEHDEKSEGSGIPNDIQLFDVFWGQVTELIRARPEFNIHDIIALLVSLMNLSLNCYPEQLSNVDNVLGFAKEQLLIAQEQNAPELKTTQTSNLFVQLLVSPIRAYDANVLTLLKFPSAIRGAGIDGASQAGNFTDILALQPYTTRRQVAHVVATTAIKAATNGFIISTIDGVNAIFGELCSVMIKDQRDGGLFGPKSSPVEEEPADGPKYVPRSKPAEELPLDWDDIVEEQSMVAKLVHLLKTEEGNAENEFALLSAARRHFGEGGELRIRFTLPALTIACIRIATLFSRDGPEDDVTKQKLAALYKFIHQTISSLAKTPEAISDDYGHSPRDDGAGSSSRLGRGLLSPPDMSLRLFVMAAKSTDLHDLEELSYEFFVQALTIYEDSISDTKAQVAALNLIIGSLYTTTVFGYENYETLITKCAVHSSRLLKRIDQCRGVILVSHLFWGDDQVKRAEDKPVYRDGKRVLECLQKALRIADSVMDQTVNIELFVDILERYLWYFEHHNEAITVKYLNSLIDLIQTNLANIDSSANASTFIAPTGQRSNPLGSGAGRSTNSLFDDGIYSPKVSDSVVKHFRNILAYIVQKKEEESRKLASNVPGVDGGFEAKGKWGDIELGR